MVIFQKILMFLSTPYGARVVLEIQEGRKEKSKGELKKKNCIL